MIGELGTLAAGYPFYRELSLTPSPFGESLSRQDERASFQYGVSLEQYPLVDADIVFVTTVSGETEFEEFLNNPVVQATPASQNNAIYPYDRDEHGYGLAGMRAAVKYIVETLTGEPFE